MSTSTDDEEGKLDSLVVILPLAVVGFALVAACWSLLSVAGIHIRQEMELTGVQFGLLLSLPMAVGALVAIPGGVAAQVFGARRVMMVCLAGLSLCMMALLPAPPFTTVWLAGAGLGLAGAYYSAGLQFVTSHAPEHRTGLVLGVFGAGITGVGMSYYLVPLILEGFSWSVVPLAYLIMLLLLLALMVLLTSQEPTGGNMTDGALTPVWVRLSRLRLWQLSGWYGVVAGGFFALALWLPDFMMSQHHFTVEAGAELARWFVIPGALAQIPGGWLADRYGSTSIVTRGLMVCLVALFFLSYPPMTLVIQGIHGTLDLHYVLPLPVELSLVVVLGVAMGCSMAGLQRQVVVDNRETIAVAAGVLLVSACSVAFLLPPLFGAANDWVGVRSAVFMILFLMLSLTLFLFARTARRDERRRLLHPGI